MSPAGGDRTRRAVALSAALGLIAAALATGGAAPKPPDLVLLHGRLFTADASQPWEEAIAIRGDRIQEVGTSKAIAAMAGPATRRIDLAGRVVVPGFNDAHNHVGPRAAGIRLELKAPEPSFDETLAAVRAAAAADPAGQRIFGEIGADVFDDPRATRFALDEAAPGRFVYLSSFTGHGVLASTAAFRALGIPEEPEDPPGGWFERMPGSRRASGVIQEYAKFALGRRLARGEPRAAWISAWRDISAEAIRLGITTIQNMSNDVTAEEAARAAAEAQVPIRVRQIRFPMSHSRGWLGDEGRFQPPSRGSSLVTVSGFKWILDGTPVERGAAMRTPYADRPSTSGRMNFTDEDITAMLQTSRRTGEPVMLHCSGDRSVEAVLRRMEALGGAPVWAGRRVRIEHGDGLMSDLYPLARRLGVVVVQNPSHFIFPALFSVRLGDQAPRYQPVRSLKAAGIPLAIGSDGPMSPFLNILWATTNPNHPEEALTREEAVEAYTRGSAFAEFAEGRKGMLRRGQLADLAVLSQDIFRVESEKLPATESVLTIVGGRIVFEKPASPLPAR